MPRYDIVVHVSAELDAATPEQAAALFVHCLRTGVDAEAAVRGLALWRPHDGASATPLPAPLPEQLADFFGGVEWRAEIAEAAFRLEVEQLFGDGQRDNAEGGAIAGAGERAGARR